MKNTIHLLTMLIAITSCTISKNSASGVYIFIDKNNPEINEAVHLYPDGKFNYRFSNSMSPYPVIQGDWKLVNDTAILNSSKTYVDFTNDTIRLKNIKYKVNANSIVRCTKHGKLKLKKIREHFKKYLLDGQLF